MTIKQGNTNIDTELQKLDKKMTIKGGKITKKGQKI